LSGRRAAAPFQHQEQNRGVCRLTEEECTFCTILGSLTHEPKRFLRIVSPFVHFLQYSLDSRTGFEYPFPRSGCSLFFATICSVTTQVMLSVPRVSLSNPGNNRPLPQILWDAIERFG
jgi:hypothetical protein